MICPTSPRPPAPSSPSPRALVRSTLVALAVAVVVLVGLVLPAEYGVDPTGIGRVFGLTEMGQIKVQLAQEAAAEDAAALAAANAPPVVVSDSVASAAEADAERVTRVTLAPGEGKEVKLVMAEGGRAAYAWETDRGVVNYDTHADGSGIDYHGYGKGTGVPSDEGVLVAAFDGKHGWFWRNRTRETLTVTLRTSGDVEGVVGP